MLHVSQDKVVCHELTLTHRKCWSNYTLLMIEFGFVLPKRRMPFKLGPDLGPPRLAENCRASVNEATAPIRPQIAAQVRPWLANCFRFAGSTLRLVRHDSLWPLVKRLVHPDSGMQKIPANPIYSIASQDEKKTLAQRYGGTPW
jgi:hypothetical protein